jgi:hypothetical protein
MDIASGFALYDSRLAIFIAGTQTAQVRQGAALSARNFSQAPRFKFMAAGLSKKTG